MSIASKYSPKVAWRTIASSVYQLTRETLTDPATYRLSVAVIDSNNPGAGQKDIGYFFVDYMGSPYSIIAVSGATIDVRDDFRIGLCPTSGKPGMVYQSVYEGRALYLSPENFQHLHPLALANSHKYDVALLWSNDPNTKKIPFTNQSTPTITGYQSDQIDGFNLAEDYGENPNVRLIITVDANNRYQRQQMPQFTYINGLIDTVYFDLGEDLTGYFLISKS